MRVVSKNTLTFFAKDGTVHFGFKCKLLKNLIDNKITFPNGKTSSKD